MRTSILITIIGGLSVPILYLSEAVGAFGAFGLFILVTFIGMTLYSGEQKKKRKKQTADNENELSIINGFKATNKLVGPWGLIAIDTDSKQIAFKNKGSRVATATFSNIQGCEVIEDGKVTYQKSNTLGRAVVGGIIAGGAGAVIGGLTGSSKQKIEVKNLDFKIILKDVKNPHFVIRFFDCWEETARTKKSIKIDDAAYGPIFQKASKNLQVWKDIIEGIIDESNSKQPTQIKTTTSISDELLKLNELKEKGILTDEEFKQQKGKILNA